MYFPSHCRIFNKKNNAPHFTIDIPTSNDLNCYVRTTGSLIWRTGDVYPALESCWHHQRLERDDHVLENCFLPMKLLLVRFRSRSQDRSSHLNPQDETPKSLLTE